MVERVVERSREDTLLSGVETLVRLLVLRQQLDERDGLDDRHHGLRATRARRWARSTWPSTAWPTCSTSTGSSTARGSTRSWPRRRSGAARWAPSSPTRRSTAWPAPGTARRRGWTAAATSLKHANAMGSGPNGGVVMFCGDDPTAKSSTLACDSQYTFEDACMPVLYPGDQQDVLDLGVHAFRLSRYAGAGSGSRSSPPWPTASAPSTSTRTGTTRATPIGVVVDGQPWRHEPLATVGRARRARPGGAGRAAPAARRPGLRAAQRARPGRRAPGPGARLGIVCAGKTYFDVIAGLRRPRGATIWPTSACACSSWG